MIIIGWLIHNFNYFYKKFRYCFFQILNWKWWSFWLKILPHISSTITKILDLNIYRLISAIFRHNTYYEVGVGVWGLWLWLGPWSLSFKRLLQQRPHMVKKSLLGLFLKSNLICFNNSWVKTPYLSLVTQPLLQACWHKKVIFQMPL